MNDHRPIVEHFNEVKQNVSRFHNDLQSHPALQDKLSQFRHWYYIPDSDQFGPSKYVGYTSMDFETYKSHHRQRMDGRRTEEKLKSWFDVLNPGSLESDYLYEKLKEFINRHGKRLKSNAAIHVPRGWKLDNVLSIDIIEDLLNKMSDDYLERRAKEESSNNKTNKTRQITVTTYDRSPYIRELAMRRAKGICQLCENPAPFHDLKGRPYLESHHIQWLSKGGPDTIDNTVALCANCHRKMHVLNLQEDREKLQQKVSDSQYVSRSRC